jgi:hypothetical protein
MKTQKLRILNDLIIAILFLSIISAIIIFMSASASADPVYGGSYIDMYLKTNTFPGSLNEEKVYLDEAESSTIIGHVGSQTDLRLITFSSTTDVLDAANGYATIKSASDDYINNITITAPGYLFEDLIFSLNLAPNDNNDLTITVTDGLGGTDIFTGWTSLADWVNGENRILVLSTSGNLMQSITINSVYGIEGLGGGLDQLKQTEISGLALMKIPEPATMLLFGIGLIGLAGLRRIIYR